VFLCIIIVLRNEFYHSNKATAVCFASVPLISFALSAFIYFDFADIFPHVNYLSDNIFFVTYIILSFYVFYILHKYKKTGVIEKSIEEKKDVK